MSRTASVIGFGILLLSCAISRATPGDTLYVRGNNVNVRSAPSLRANVLRQVHYGHVVIEIRRYKQWVHVSLAHSTVKTGWIYAPLLRAVPQQ